MSPIAVQRAGMTLAVHNTLLEIAQALNRIDGRLDTIDGRLDRVETHMGNLSSHVEELGVAMGTMNDRLTEVEKATNRVARKAGTTGVPAVGGGRVPAMPVSAKPGAEA